MARSIRPRSGRRPAAGAWWPTGGRLADRRDHRNMRAGYLRKNGVPYSAERQPHRVLRRRPRSPGGQTARCHNRRRRPAVPAPAVHRQLAFQEGSGRFQMGSHAMPCKVLSLMITTHRPSTLLRAPRASVEGRGTEASASAKATADRPGRRSRKGRRLSLCVVFAASWITVAPAFAQFELVGSWAARNTEDISRDSYPGGLRRSAAQRRGAHAGADLQRVAAGDDRAPVRGMAAVLFRAGAVRPADLERRPTRSRAGRSRTRSAPGRIARR